MTNRLSQSAVYVLYLIAGLLPLLFLPAPFGIETGREIVFTILSVVAGILWLVSVLSAGEIRYPVSPVLYIAGITLLVYGASAVLSHAPSLSLFFADAGAERFMTLGIGIALMAVAAGALRSRGTAGAALLMVIFAGAAAAALSLYTFLAGPIGLLPVQPYFNVVGTLNGLALFYASLLIMAVGLLLSPTVGAWKGWVRAILAAAAILFLFNLVLIHFRTAWILVLGSAVCLFGLLLTNISMYQNVETSRRFGWRQWAAMGCVVLAIVMLMAPGPLVAGVTAPVEVSPSVSATFRIAGAVFREGPLRVFFGSGPGTFGLDWARHKEVAINQTVFWNVRFNQGQSWIATALPTAGTLGFGSLALLFGAMLFVFLRMMLAPAPSDGAALSLSRRGDALVTGVFLGWVSLAIAAFLYPANVSLMLLFFLTAGILTSLLAVPLPKLPDVEGTEPVPEAPVDETKRAEVFEVELQTGTRAAETTSAQSGFWDIRQRQMQFHTPWIVFASSLAMIFFIAVGIAALYGEAARIRGALAADRGVRSFQEGKVEEAIGHMERAVAQEPRNGRTLQTLVQLRTEKVRGLLQRASEGADVRQDFQAAVSLAIQDSQRLTSLHPYEPLVWRIQGSLYEALIPFIQGSERFATSAYQRATEREPQNPAAYVDWGRAGLTFTDRIAVLASQAQGKDREDLEKARTENLQQIAEIFRRAIQLKPDFASAHFLLAQTAIRLGDIDGAIASAENAKQSAPLDIGIAFQLGLLHYQKGALDRAQEEFERAVTINENYANARYFLGLIYDRKKEPQKALEEFDRIARLNPNNQEVARIIANLTVGKPALDGIVPPAHPPQERKEVPVAEQERNR